MNRELLNAVKQIVAQQGESILYDSKRVSAFLTDLAKDVPKPPKNALVKCIEHGYAKVLKEAPKAERAVIKQKLGQRLHGEEGFDVALCAEVLDLLTVVFFGEAELKAEQAAATKQAEAERKKTEDEAKRKQEAERARMETDARKIAQAESARIEAERARAEAERRTIEAENRAKAEAERARAAAQTTASKTVQKKAPPKKKFSIVEFLTDFGFEDADFPGYGINLPLSIILCLAVTGFVTYLMSLILPGLTALIAIVCLVLSFMAFYLTHIKLRIIFGIIAGLGLIVAIINGVSSPNVTPASSQPAVSVPLPPPEPPTPFQQAVAFYDNSNYDMAVPIFEELAEEGHAGAQGYLGHCFFLGNGVAQSNASAIEWWTKAAEQGDARGQYGLGYCYAYGNGGLAQNYAKAVEYLTPSAEQGYVGSQYTLGRCYQYGWGVPKDFDIAEEWYTKAAEQGDKQAKEALNDWSFRLRDTL